MVSGSGFVAFQSLRQRGSVFGGGVSIGVVSYFAQYVYDSPASPLSCTCCTVI